MTREPYSPRTEQIIFQYTIHKKAFHNLFIGPIGNKRVEQIFILLLGIKSFESCLRCKKKKK